MEAIVSVVPTISGAPEVPDAPAVPYYQRWNTVPEYLTYLRALDDSTVTSTVKGDLFEQFTLDLLRVHPEYNIGVQRIFYAKDADSTVLDIIGFDKPRHCREIGMDLIIEYTDGSYGIVQAKCYAKRTLTIDDLNGFYFAKTTIENNGGNVSHWYVTSTCEELSHGFDQNTNVEFILHDKLFEKPEAMGWIREYYATNRVPAIHNTLEYFHHQYDCAFAVKKRLIDEGSDKALILHMCGSGKTITGIGCACLLSEDIPLRRIVIFVPWVELASQTVAEWKTYFRCEENPMAISFLVVSSDRHPKAEVATTTDEKRIAEFMNAPNPMKVVVCVYNSSMKLKHIPFDLGFYDEAHHTVCPFIKPRYECADWTTIPKKIFMTATAKTCPKPEFRSMDRDYGTVVHSYNLGQGIRDGRLNPYKIYIARYAGDKVPKNVLFKGAPCPSSYAISARAILDAIQSGRKQILTYHNEIEHAKYMVEVLTQYLAENGVHVKVDCVSSKNTRFEKRDIISRFKSGDITVLCTVSMFKEGINIPGIDAIVFCDPRCSEIDILQCIGRCLRKSLGKLPSLIMVPFLGSEDKNPFEMIRRVLLIMAQEDGALVDEITVRPAENSRIGFRTYAPDSPNTVEEDVMGFTDLLNDLRIHIFNNKWSPCDELKEYASEAEYEFFLQHCDAQRAIPVNRWLKEKSPAPFVKEVASETGIDLAQIQTKLISQFSELTSEQRERLWAYPHWRWETVGADHIVEWTWMFTKVLAFCQTDRALPQPPLGGLSPGGTLPARGNDGSEAARLGLWIHKQREMMADRKPLTPTQVGMCNELQPYGFQWDEPNRNLTGMKRAVYDACLRQVALNGPIIRVASINEQELEQIRTTTGSKAKLIANSVSQNLGELVNAHYLISVGKGQYQLVSPA